MKNIREVMEQTHNITLLYVEDNKETRMQFVELLTILFFSVETAYDGLDALQKYKLKKYDLVITDIDMPRMNGVKLTKAIRKINKSQKVIIVSAHDSSEYLLQCISINVDDFILKPVDMQQLENVLLKISHLIHAEKLLSAYHEELEKEIELKTVKLLNQLKTDELTGLLNRRALNSMLKTDIEKIFILINIDNFDSLNITCGYTNGDLILKGTAQFLKKYTPKYAQLYYLGVDEFAIVSNKMSIDEAYDFATILHNKIQENNIIISHFNIKFTFTIAISQGSKNIFKNARIALKEARTKGKNRINIYNKNSPIEVLQSNIQKYLPILKTAILYRYITPYFHPIINNKTQKIEKYESLARIIDTHGNIYQPFEFIKIAELTGLIPDITRIMIDKTFMAFKDNNFTFSINISEYDLNDGYLIEFFKACLKKYNIKASRVVIEVLEGASIGGAQEEIDQLKQLQNLGFFIAIDDFGTENSNFERVHNLNIDFIKIDGSFIKNIDIDKKSYNITKTIVVLAKSIGAEVIAEFVHSKAVLDKVNELDIKYSQGYYFAQPTRDIVYEF